MLYVCFSNQRPIQQQEMILGNQFTNTVATKTTTSDTHECNQTCTDRAQEVTTLFGLIEPV
jgi:hypothetical protein